jgi:Flp pilus assembly pilin Flp
LFASTISGKIVTGAAQADDEVTIMVRYYRAVGGRLWTDVRGQDMIEYALLAAAIAVVVAGFLPPAVMPAVSTIFSKIVSGFNAS